LQLVHDYAQVSLIRRFGQGFPLWATEVKKANRLSESMMDGQDAAQRTDALLLPFLQATTEAESERLLTSLFAEQAGPIINGIIRSKLHAADAVDDRLRWQDADDVYGEVVAQLLTRLRELKSSPSDATIESFPNYVAVTTYNACHHHLRRKYPQRWRLKNRLRYLLTHQPELGLWEAADGTWLCGFAEFREQEKVRPVAAGALHKLLSTNSADDIPRSGLTDLVFAILKLIKEPVELDALVNTVAELQGIKDLPLVTNDEHEESTHVSDSHTQLTTEVERRSYLQRIWSEILNLPTGQRVALLLNLRDLHEGVIILLPVTGVATIRQIAEAVAMPAEEFAKLWNDLPIDDSAIAIRLGVTRQQVINLRKSARARLARRMRALEETSKKTSAGR
jgi:hypothetical protein